MTQKIFTVADLIEFLKTQDQDAILQIVEHTCGTSYYDQGGNASEENFDPERHVEYTDFRGNRYVKESDPHFNKRYLLLGARDA